MAKQNQPYCKVKSPATIEAQLEKLISRGCIIEDTERAEFALKNINYYRLVHYFSVYLDPYNKSRYLPGTSFDKVMHIYDFDRLLRSLLLTALEEVEITLRAHISNYHAFKYGALGYLNEASFDSARHNHKQFIKKMERLIEANGGEGFVAHHNKKYGGAFPVWVIMELFSFGTLNSFFCDLSIEDKKAISETAFGYHWRCVENWIQCLSDLRNFCAHYNRLYDNRLDMVPKQPPDSERAFSNTLYDYLLILKRMYPRKDMWEKSFMLKLGMLIAEYSDFVEVKFLGFPENWYSELNEEL